MKNKFGIIDNIAYTNKCIRFWDKSINIYFEIYILTFSIAPVLNVLFPRIIINQIVEQTEWMQIVRVIVGFSAMMLLTEIVREYVRTVYDAKITYIRFQFIGMLYKKVMKIEYSELENPSTLDRIEQSCTFMGSSVRGMATYIKRQLEIAIDCLFLLVFFLMLMSLKKWVLLVLLLCGIGQFLVEKKQVDYEYSREIDKERIKRRLRYYVDVFSKDSYGKDIRLFKMKDLFVDQMSESIRDYSGIIRAFLKRESMKDILCGLFLCIREVTIYTYLISEVQSGKIKIGDFAFFLFLIIQYTSAVVRLSNNFSQIGSDNKLLTQFRRFSENQEEDSKEDVVSYKDMEIVFENVSFAYPGTKREVLKNINLRINKGDSLGIVGENASGKTTLIKLICGFYKPTAGRILINGKDITTLDAEAYRRSISSVFQDVNVLEFTVAENIAMKSLNLLDIDTCEKELCNVGLEEKLHTWAKGILTFIGKNISEEGIYLSGGEGQRLVIARGDYKKAPLIMLDEPTSALDPIAEKDIYEKYNRMVNGKTSVYVSHRLSSTKFCNKIIVMKDGSICEMGTHDELMKMNGTYAELFEVQSQYYGECQYAEG